MRRFLTPSIHGIFARRISYLSEKGVRKSGKLLWVSRTPYSTHWCACGACRRTRSGTLPRSVRFGFSRLPSRSWNWAGTHAAFSPTTRSESTSTSAPPVFTSTSTTSCARALRRWSPRADLDSPAILSNFDLAVAVDVPKINSTTVFRSESYVSNRDVVSDECCLASDIGFAYAAFVLPGQRPAQMDVANVHLRIARQLECGTTDAHPRSARFARDPQLAAPMHQFAEVRRAGNRDIRLVAGEIHGIHRDTSWPASRFHSNVAHTQRLGQIFGQPDLARQVVPQQGDDQVFRPDQCDFRRRLPVPNLPYEQKPPRHTGIPHRQSPVHTGKKRGAVVGRRDRFPGRQVQCCRTALVHVHAQTYRKL